MEIKPIAVFRSPLKEKFGIPRQAGLAPSLMGEVVLEPMFRSPESIKGLEDFDYIWLVWGFSLNRREENCNMTVRPPRLGGNERVGVFASRSPFRPNGIGLSSVKIEHIDAENGTITVSGADLADGTPVFDIKPYVEYADSHTGIRSGFVDKSSWKVLKVEMPRECMSVFSDENLSALKEILSQDPRPQYQDDPERIYGLLFESRNVRFRVKDDVLTVISVE
ncbi:MAG: tRNA (N6-threonylcarbamoyladenosine(37)-N6)-methyltransferase TrmO [Bacteroidales bacterium]|nr:tRNA (N6-threonylcarbamoyladenosine(37)-N6)-methyltransferase TrmO [Bacteroidales bacterium]